MDRRALKPPHPFRPGEAERTHGYSLLELLLALALIGILTVVGVSFTPRGRIDAREAARVVAADLNRARSEAIRLNTNVAIDFDNAACSDYCIYTDPNRSGSPNGTLDGGFTLSQPILLDRPIEDDFPRMEVEAAAFGASPRIWFDVRGLPRTSTGAYLGSTGAITLAPVSGEAGYRVTLEPQGRVLVESE